MRLTSIVSFAAVLTASAALANPYPDPRLVPVDATFPQRKPLLPLPAPEVTADSLQTEGIEVLRVQVDWEEPSETYRLALIRREKSGTPALVLRARTPDPLGSYKGQLRDAATGEVLFHDAIGTGAEFRKLTRAITFRFPVPDRPVQFSLTAENPATGEIQPVLETRIDPSLVQAQSPRRRNVRVRILRKASVHDASKLLINIYAEGYTSDRRAKFWKDAKKAIETLEANGFPLFERMEFRAVFAPSQLRLGEARNLGLPVPERRSFLGLYYAYWDTFIDRWYHVVYPTREEKYRDGLAQAPYDYPIVLVDSEEYWGVGNYKELTAVPSDDDRFSYLLLHEIGHFFGLNEEYEAGGPTELAFAPGITEPWSQNITFLASAKWIDLKWNAFVKDSTPLPTPEALWIPLDPVYGAYPGGYAQTEPRGRSHKPGRYCTMERAPRFCPVCRDGIGRVVRRDLGEPLSY